MAAKLIMGTPQEVMADEQSLTGAYLSGRRFIPVPLKRRPTTDKWLEIKGAKENNLKGINVKIPLGVFSAVTGVSGSGKSTLVNEILYKTLARDLNKAKIVRESTKKFAGLRIWRRSSRLTSHQSAAPRVQTLLLYGIV